MKVITALVDKHNHGIYCREQEITIDNPCNLIRQQRRII